MTFLFKRGLKNDSLPQWLWKKICNPTWIRTPSSHCVRVGFTGEKDHFVRKMDFWWAPVFICLCFADPSSCSCPAHGFMLVSYLFNTGRLILLSGIYLPSPKLLVYLGKWLFGPTGALGTAQRQHWPMVSFAGSCSRAAGRRENCFRRNRWLANRGVKSREPLVLAAVLRKTRHRHCLGYDWGGSSLGEPAPPTRGDHLPLRWAVVEVEALKRTSKSKHFWKITFPFCHLWSCLAVRTFSLWHWETDS